MERYNHTVKTTCKFCRKEFQSFALKKVCDVCDRDMERQFEAIKEYLSKFPEATVTDICNGLNIPTSLVKYYLKEEKLEITKNSGNYFLKCSKCGKILPKGRYCFDCEIEVTRFEMKTTLKKDLSGITAEGEPAKFNSQVNLRTRTAK